ncbi:MAG: hypothetical protein ACOY82_16375 [Pseudomonadota bacterium]
MYDNNPYAPPEAAVSDIAGSGEPLPTLWNPGAATAWSLLFSPVFGAILQMKNWQALGEPTKAAGSRRWAIGCAIYTVLIGTSAMFLPESRAIDRAINLSGVVVLLIWYYANGREQIGHVKARFGRTYPRRGWAVPILIALGVMIAFVAAMTLVAIAVMSARGEF